MTRPFQAGRAGPFGERGNFPQSVLAGVVDVRIDADAVLLRQPKQQVELTVEVPVLHDGIDPPDHVRPHPERLVHQLEGARGGEHAVLREGDNLEIGGMGEGRLDLQQRLDVPDADVGADVGVAAKGGGSGGDGLAYQVRGPLGRRRELRPQTALGGDAARPAGAGGVGEPGQPGQRLVEMHVAVEHARQGEQPATVDHPGAFRVECRSDRFDDALGHADVHVTAIGEADLREQRGIGMHVCHLLIFVDSAAQSGLLDEARYSISSREFRDVPSRSARAVYLRQTPPPPLSGTPSRSWRTLSCRSHPVGPKRRLAGGSRPTRGALERSPAPAGIERSGFPDRFSILKPTRATSDGHVGAPTDEGSK